MPRTFIISVRPHWFAAHVPTPLILHPTSIELNSHKYPLSTLKITPACLPNALVLTSPRRIATISAHPDHQKDWQRLHTALTRPSASYIPLSILGRGAFGIVYQARAPDGRMVAVKRVEKSALVDCAQYAAARREARVLKRLPVHRNLVQVHQVRETERAFLTVMEKMECTLLQLVEEHVLEEDEMVRIATEVLQGLSILHSRGMVHRDVKLENVLVGKAGEIKLCDFGLTIEERGILGDVVGTGYARAPEIGNAKRYDRKVDLWGVGILLFVMKFRRMPFDQVGEMKGGVEDWGGKDWVGVGDTVKGLLKGLLEKDPAKRLDTTQALTYAGGMEYGKEDRGVVGRGEQQVTFKMAADKIVKLLRIMNTLKANLRVSMVREVDGGRAPKSHL